MRIDGGTERLPHDVQVPGPQPRGWLWAREHHMLELFDELQQRSWLVRLETLLIAFPQRHD